MKSLHKQWLQHLLLKYDIYHPELAGFCESLKNNQAKTSGCITSTAITSLPCQVQTQTSEEHNLGWHDSSTRIVYVGLTGVLEGYAVKKNNDGFEVL